MGLSIRDVAKACGVSTYTISSVINEKGRVSEKTRQEVMQKVRELGYEPSRNIPHARKQQLKRLALVMPFGQVATATFYMRALRSCKNACIRAGRELVIYSENELSSMLSQQFHRGRSQLNCDGLILYAPRDGYTSMVETLRSWDVPVAVVRRQLNIQGVYSITDDDYAASRMLTDYMLKLGHRCLGLIGPMRGGTMARQRIKGFRDAIEARGLRFYEDMIIPCAGGNNNKSLLPLREAAGPAIKKLRSQGLNITGLCLVNDALSGKLIGSLFAQGFRVPEDIAIGGIGNEPICTQLVPTITAVNMPIEAMVKKAVHCLLNDHPDAQRNFILENDIVERESTCRL